MRPIVSYTCWILVCNATIGHTDSPPFQLWDETAPLPTAKEAREISQIRFSRIKQREPEVDGFKWLHGVAIVRHAGSLFASWGHNRGQENTSTEITQGRRSDDDGRTWGDVELISRGDQTHAVSHGAFLSHDNRLWLFCGQFRGKRQDTSMVAFQLNRVTDRWDTIGVVAEQSFWPMAEPQRMADGNWIIAGFQVESLNPPAVAISHGDDLNRWDVVTIPLAEGIGRLWGESAVIVDDSELMCIARYGEEAVALVSVSKDFGRTWSGMKPSNLPMATSKPYAGVLSTGQRYLIGNTTANCGHRRDPLTIALSRPGEKKFSKIRIIRRGERTESSDPRGTKLSYPYAKEYDGKLYIAYSVGHLPANQNHAELAVVPISEFDR